jgi:hypothetical protein
MVPVLLASSCHALAPKNIEPSVWMLLLCCYDLFLLNACFITKMGMAKICIFCVQKNYYGFLVTGRS